MIHYLFNFEKKMLSVVNYEHFRFFFVFVFFLQTKLFVGNLEHDGRIRAEDLRPLFEQFGKVTECECIKNYA